MKGKNSNNSRNRERMLYQSMKQMDEVLDDAEDMMEEEDSSMSENGCKKRKCEMGKRKMCE